MIAAQDVNLFFFSNLFHNRILFKPFLCCYVGFIALHVFIRFLLCLIVL